MSRRPGAQLTSRLVLAIAIPAPLKAACEMKPGQTLSER